MSTRVLCVSVFTFYLVELHLHYYLYLILLFGLIFFFLFLISPICTYVCLSLLKNQLKKHFQKISASRHQVYWKYFSIFDKPHQTIAYYHTLPVPHIPIYPSSPSHIFTQYHIQKLQNTFVTFQLLNTHFPLLKYSTFYCNTLQ